MHDKPELKWLPMSALYVNKSYQRTTESGASKKNIKAMTNDFQWALCGAITVCRDPKAERHAIIDGQHRYTAAKTCGAKEMPCMIIQGYDTAGQAKNFLVMNENRVAINQLSAFHAAVAAGQPDAINLKKILDQCKITVSFVPKGDTGPKETNAIGTLLKLVTKHNEKHIKWALTMIPDAYGDRRGQMRAMLLKAMAEFSQRNPGADRSAMAMALQGVDPRKMEAEVRASVKIQGGDNVEIMVDMLEKLYKKALKEKVA